VLDDRDADAQRDEELGRDVEPADRVVRPVLVADVQGHLVALDVQIGDQARGHRDAVVGGERVLLAGRDRDVDRHRQAEQGLDRVQDADLRREAQVAPGEALDVAAVDRPAAEIGVAGLAHVVEVQREVDTDAEVAQERHRRDDVRGQPAREDLVQLAERVLEDHRVGFPVHVQPDQEVEVVAHVRRHHGLDVVGVRRRQEPLRRQVQVFGLRARHAGGERRQHQEYGSQPESLHHELLCLRTQLAAAA